MIRPCRWFESLSRSLFSEALLSRPGQLNQAAPGWEFQSLQVVLHNFCAGSCAGSEFHSAQVACASRFLCWYLCAGFAAKLELLGAVEDRIEGEYIIGWHSDAESTQLFEDVKNNWQVSSFFLLLLLLPCTFFLIPSSLHFLLITSLHFLSKRSYQ